MRGRRNFFGEIRFIPINESSDASHAYAEQTLKPPEKCEDVSVSAVFQKITNQICATT